MAGEMAVRKSSLMIFLGIVLFATGVIGISIICGMYYATSLAKTQYGIVIDGGSSHTSMFTYSWPVDDKTNGAVNLEQYHRCDVQGGGLSSYQENPSEAGLRIEKCLDESSHSIPWASRLYTPVYLGATAGMRLVKMKNKTVAHNIIESVKDTIGTTDLDSSYLDQRVKIISGHVEAESAWISVNSILGLLGDVSLLLSEAKSKWFEIIPSGTEETIGVLDLGGASTQIAFDLTNSSGIPDEYRSDLELYDTKFDLFTDSFLCYGLNEARGRLLSLLANKNNYTSKLNHPCFNAGYNKTRNYEEVFESVCTKPYRPAQGISRNVTIIGTGNSTECDSLVYELFDQRNCNYSSCSFDGHPLPKLPKKLVARSSFYYAMSGLGVLNGASVDKAEFEQSMQEYCSKTWPDAQNTSFKYPAYLCLYSHYINNLLTKVYGLDSFNGLMFANQLRDMDVEWTLGYMMEQSSSESKRPSLKLFRISMVWFIILSVITAILIIIGLVLIVVSCSVPKYRQGYRSVGMRSQV